MPYIIEYIGASGVRTSDMQVRLHKIKPGDPVDCCLFEDQYPFTHGRYARVDQVFDDGRITICCGGGSHFLCEDGSVSVSGGPFANVKPTDIKSCINTVGANTHRVRFWNWGDHSAGADQGVDYYIDRPLHMLVAFKGHRGWKDLEPVRPEWMGEDVFNYNIKQG